MVHSFSIKIRLASLGSAQEQAIHIITGRALIENKHAADGRRRGMTVNVVDEIVNEELEKEKEEQKRLFRLEKSAPRYLSALNEEFEPQWWWIPVFEQYRKLAITGATILIGRGEIDQLIIGILIAMVAALVYFATMPYKDFNDDLFSMFAHFQIFLVLLWSLLVKFQKLMEVSHDDFAKEIFEIDSAHPVDPFTAPTTLLQTPTLGWLLIISNLSVMLVFGCFMLLEYKTVKNSVTARKRWDQIKLRFTEDNLSEEDVLKQLGEGLSHVDRESILSKIHTLERESKSNSGSGEIELLDFSKNKQKRKSKGAMLAKKRASLEFAQENPILSTNNKISERPFGGTLKEGDKQQEIRHLSEADAVGLGASEVAVSQHEKYANRAKDKETEVPAHIARAMLSGAAVMGGKKKSAKKVGKLWEKKFDEDNKTAYYENKNTGVSQWERPADY